MTDQSAAKSIPSTQTKISFFTKRNQGFLEKRLTPDVGQETYTVSLAHRPQGRVDAAGDNRLRISPVKGCCIRRGNCNAFKHVECI